MFICLFKVNMQNLPRKSPLKDAICAPTGYTMIDCDLSQIEARTLAWLAEEHDLVEAFDRGDDVYKIMASSIYGKPVDKINDSERFVGKTTILGAGYGMGAMKFQAQLKNFGVELDEDECKRIIHVYRETYQWIPMLWRNANDALEALMEGGGALLGKWGVLDIDEIGIRLPNNLHIKYPNLRRQEIEGGKTEIVYDTRRGRSVIANRIYGGKVIENVCQALARIVIGEQLLGIAKKYKVVMTVHDAIACIVPNEEVEEARQKLALQSVSYQNELSQYERELAQYRGREDVVVKKPGLVALKINRAFEDLQLQLACETGDTTACLKD